MNSHIPSSAGAFRVVREKRNIRGRAVRVSSLVFTSHDGFVAEVPMNGRRSWQEMRQEAYYAAVAQRAGAMYRGPEKGGVPGSDAWCDVQQAGAGGED